MLVGRGHKQHSGGSRELLDLWFTHTRNELTGASIYECEQTLSDAELTRSQAFRFEKDRCRYLATRLLVRNALSQYLPIPPQALQFRANRYGKPALDPDCGLRFNVSHSTDVVFCLIGKETELGVDAEPLIRASDIANLSNDFLSPRELAQFELLPDCAKSNRAITLWTLKEAYVKAQGFGLSKPLETVSFIFEEHDQIRLDSDPSQNVDAANWRFGLLDLLGHRVALAVETRDRLDLQIWEAGSIAASKTRQFPDAEIWFPSIEWGHRIE
jgi:4'-phosphopantetheinyl transferase